MAVTKRQKIHFFGIVWIAVLITIALSLVPRVSDVGFESDVHMPSTRKTPTKHQRERVFSDQVITHGSRDKKMIALTFDADMNRSMRNRLISGVVKSWYDEKLIATLIQTNTKATLFLSGMWIELYPRQTKQLAQNPLFELANHSYSHPSFDGYCYGLPQISDLADREEVGRTQELLANVGGVRNNHYFRFPGGCFGAKDLIIMKQLEMSVVHWDVAANDGFNNNSSRIINNVLSQTQNGSIIVMHMNGYPNEPKTAQALPIIIQKLKDRGFEFVKVSELLEPI